MSSAAAYPSRVPPAVWAAFVAWVVALVAVLAMPALFPTGDLGDQRTRFTVRLALVYYAAAAALLIRGDGPDPAAETDRGLLARVCWTLGWATYLVHLAMAFHYFHQWSHADAFEHTYRRSGYGEGIYISHLFTLVWTLEVAVWWLWPAWRATRPAWVGWLLHGFLAFIVFNGTVVYETGFIRYAGAVMFAFLGALWLLARRSARTARG